MSVNYNNKHKQYTPSTEAKEDGTIMVMPINSNFTVRIKDYIYSPVNFDAEKCKVYDTITLETIYPPTLKREAIIERLSHRPSYIVLQLLNKSTFPLNDFEKEMNTWVFGLSGGFDNGDEDKSDDNNGASDDPFEFSINENRKKYKMKRNEIIKKLVGEGFTEKTLANLSDPQIMTLAKRIIGEQIVKGSVVVPKATANPVDIKRMTDQGVNVELREDKKETKEAARTFANQNRKNMPQGTKFQAGRANKNKFKKEETAKVGTITKPYKTLGKSNEIKENDGLDNLKPKAKKSCKTTKPVKSVKKLDEVKEVKQWIDGLIKENYHSLTTKDEIMELINIKLNEQAPAPAEPTTKPTTRPEQKPERTGKPEKTPYPNPWEPPKPGNVPDPSPKYETGELPDFLKYDAIVAAVKGDNVDQLTEMIVGILREQAFNSGGEPMMTHQQYRDYSEPSEPEFGDDGQDGSDFEEPYKNDGIDPYDNGYDDTDGIGYDATELTDKEMLDMFHDAQKEGKIINIVPKSDVSDNNPEWESPLDRVKRRGY